MARVINFSAGPAALPLEVLEQARADMPDWQGSGMSVMEVSHRSKAFIAAAEQAEADLRELLGISDAYAVMFLQGGATQQFALLPMNLAQPDDTVDYLVTGSWSKKAAKEAGVVRNANVVADGADSNYTDVPAIDSWQLDSNAAYFHYTPNETIGGVEIHEPPYLDGGSDVLMEPGMCFTNEPGIYLPGRFGLRIEDICFITEDGADHFGQWQESPAAP